MGSTKPVGALEAEKIGLIDKVLCSSAIDFLSCMQKEAREVAGSADLSSSIESKKYKDMGHYHDEIESCQLQEPKEMKSALGMRIITGPTKHLCTRAKYCLVLCPV